MFFTYVTSLFTDKAMESVEPRDHTFYDNPSNISILSKWLKKLSPPKGGSKNW